MKHLPPTYMQPPPLLITMILSFIYVFPYTYFLNIFIFLLCPAFLLMSDTLHMCILEIFPS